ncbi:septation regulator SpoVG [Culicoidibacter larvae]|uniref:Putative septation protein SpoVG n=1 Tax=Culicoidibacter larvae TaxID=2579976 RepID=A0A5R8QAF2_9FIRM|nr:septation regulator SpoVG [Culicoidibacter larvae]TLG72904.1 septation protein SpoVG [Culicoidibacter larvae]
MNITNVRVRLVEKEGRMKAVVSVTLDDCFVVHDIRIIKGDGGLFVAMPSRRLSTGEFRDIAHPINAETRKLFEDAILEEYQKVLEESVEQV